MTWSGPSLGGSAEVGEGLRGGGGGHAVRRAKSWGEEEQKEWLEVGGDRRAVWRKAPGGGKLPEGDYRERYVGPEGEDPALVRPLPPPPEDDLKASNNSLNLTSQGPRQAGPEETGRDDQQLIYSTVSESHKALKRARKVKELQKRELKARKDKRKMDQRMERERRRNATKERKEREKGRKKAAEQQKTREQMGLGNVVHLHEVDPTSKAGRAQAKFIDAATAAIF